MYFAIGCAKEKVVGAGGERGYVNALGSVNSYPEWQTRGWM